MCYSNVTSGKKEEDNSVSLLTFASICGGPGAFGVFDDNIEPVRLVFDPNALDDVEFSAEGITFELDELL